MTRRLESKKSYSLKMSVDWKWRGSVEEISLIRKAHQNVWWVDILNGENPKPTCKKFDCLLLEGVECICGLLHLWQFVVYSQAVKNVCWIRFGDEKGLWGCLAWFDGSFNKMTVISEVKRSYSLFERKSNTETG